MDLGLGIAPGDALHLRPDREADDRWIVKRALTSIGALHLLEAGPELEVGGRVLAIAPVERRTMAMWDVNSGEPAAWLRRGRSLRGATILLPGDAEDLKLVRAVVGGMRLRDPQGRTLARVSSSSARTGRAQVHVETRESEPVAPIPDGGLLLLSAAVLLDELHWRPAENRVEGDLRWEQRRSVWDGVFGGAGDGGGGGGGDGGG